MNKFDQLEKFLVPISVEKPAGDSLRYDPIYDRIREAGREDPDLPQGVWVKDLKAADWKMVENLCEKALLEKSKDFQITAWLCEAWMVNYGMSGFKAGMKLLLEMSKKFWDTGFPQLEDADYDFRFSPYNWVNEKMSDRMVKMAITAPEGTGMVPYSYGEWLDITRFESKDQRTGVVEQLGSSKVVTPEDFEASLEDTPSQFYQDFLKLLSDARQITTDLEKFLDENAGEETAPTLYKVRSVLEEFLKFVRQTLTERGVLHDENSADGESANHESNFHEGVQSPESSGKISSGTSFKGTAASPLPNVGEASFQKDIVRNREEAYRVISEAADYLAKIEPHSPAPHLIKKAVKWGGMTFMDLLQEIVHDPNALAEVKKLLQPKISNSDKSGGGAPQIGGGVGSVSSE